MLWGLNSIEKFLREDLRGPRSSLHLNGSSAGNDRGKMCSKTRGTALLVSLRVRDIEGHGDQERRHETIWTQYRQVLTT